MKLGKHWLSVKRPLRYFRLAYESLFADMKEVTWKLKFCEASFN